MDYVIKNSKGVYIKLNNSGSPMTCSEKDKGLFEYCKAKNILDHIPRTMKKMHFKVEAIPDIKPREDNKIKNISKDDYVPSDNITRWMERFGTCDDIISEAKSREDELLEKLKNSDNELLDLLHIIEIDKPKDLYNGWLIYKRIKQNRKERRDIKDELLIIENVLNKFSDVSCFHRDKIQKAIDGLFTRKYTFRIIDIPTNDDDSSDSDKRQADIHGTNN